MVSREKMRFKILPSIDMQAMTHRLETTQPKKRQNLPQVGKAFKTHRPSMS